MNFTVSETEVHGIWQVVYTGKVDAQARQAAVVKGLKLIKGQPFTGLLVDLTDAEIAMSIIEEFEFGVAMSSDSQTHGVRVAFLHRPGETHLSEFLATVELNRGRTSSTFSTRQKAMEWLSRKA